MCVIDESAIDWNVVTLDIVDQVGVPEPLTVGEESKTINELVGRTEEVVDGRSGCRDHAAGTQVSHKVFFVRVTFTAHGSNQGRPVRFSVLQFPELAKEAVCVWVLHRQERSRSAA